jgi:hypothetical protein
MRTAVPFVLAALLPTIALAQPTIDATNNVPAPGSSYPTNHGPWVFEGWTGANVTWGYWMLPSNGARTFYYPATSSSSTSAQVPTANLLFTDGGSDTLFLRHTSQGREIVGEKTGLGLVVYTDPIMEIRYPCTFGTTWTDPLQASYTVSGVPVSRVGTVTGIADGYGLLELPAIDIPNVLRIKVRKVIDDNSAFINAHRVSETYYYFSADVPHPVLRLQLDSVTLGGGAPATQREAHWMYGTAVGVQGLDAGDVRFTPYPNPANGPVSILLGALAGQVRHVELIDATGRVVLRKDLPAPQGDAVQGAFTVSGLRAGLYHVRLGGAQGILGTQRLVVE